MTQPDLIELLRAECNKTSQADVARKLGYSPSAINQVLKGTYPAPQKLLVKVEEVFCKEASIPCPVQGNITLARCVSNRNLPFITVNPARVQLWTACRACEGK